MRPQNLDLLTTSMTKALLALPAYSRASLWFAPDNLEQNRDRGMSSRQPVDRECGDTEGPTSRQTLCGSI